MALNNQQRLIGQQTNIQLVYYLTTSSELLGLICLRICKSVVIMSLVSFNQISDSFQITFSDCFYCIMSAVIFTRISPAQLVPLI